MAAKKWIIEYKYSKRKYYISLVKTEGKKKKEEKIYLITTDWSRLLG